MLRVKRKPPDIEGLDLLIPDAEAKIAPFRVIGLVTVLLVYFFAFDRASANEAILLPVIFLLTLYCVGILFFSPYKYLSLQASNWFFTLTDSALIAVWLSLTGGVDSPYFVILYTAVVLNALRFRVWGTMGVACILSAIYLAMFYFGGPTKLGLADIVFRLSFVFLIATFTTMLGLLIRRHQRDLALADQRKDEFLAMLGHELRNPLACLSTAVYLWDEHTEIEWRRNSLPVIRKQLGHLVRMVDDLLDASRITQGKIVLKKSLVSMDEILRGSFESTRAGITRGNHRLHYVMGSANRLYVDGDPTRLEQVFTNLIQNAIKYTEPGGDIWVTPSANEKEISIRVKDSGIGMPPEALERVFDLFVQAEASLARSGGGLGIGLTLAKELVTLHGGTIRAHSGGPGTGSEFVVTLPRAEEELVNRMLQESNFPRGASNKYRILLVEDAVDVSAMMVAMLRRWGYEVAVAPDGESALEMLREKRPELILLDIGLPHMDGYEVASRIRNDLGDKSPYLVALSGYGREEDKRRAKACGVNLHLTKPVPPAVLRRVLDTAPVSS